MKYLKGIFAVFIVVSFNCRNTTEKVVEVASGTVNDLHETTKLKTLDITPIQHASMILAHEDEVIYVNPVGGIEQFADLEKPDYILITDIHSDHFDPKTLRGLTHEMVTLIVPQAVKDQLSNLQTQQTIVMNNGDKIELKDLSIEALPMYNLRKEALKYHEKGRGNGYLLTLGEQHIYISGDTEDIPEMRHLENIDVAFICMNLPYTMTVESAASAVLDFKPKKVYPYHYRGEDGLSDVDKFKAIINKATPDIEVVQLDWYP